jgi:hypothetical protein
MNALGAYQSKPCKVSNNTTSMDELDSSLQTRCNTEHSQYAVMASHTCCKHDVKMSPVAAKIKMGGLQAQTVRQLPSTTAVLQEA